MHAASGILYVLLRRITNRRMSCSCRCQCILYTGHVFAFNDKLTLQATTQRLRCATMAIELAAVPTSQELVCRLTRALLRRLIAVVCIAVGGRAHPRRPRRIRLILSVHGSFGFSRNDVTSDIRISYLPARSCIT